MTPDPTSTEGGTAGHTPTPWGWIGSKGKPEARIYLHGGESGFDQVLCDFNGTISEEDGAHIVHCVNTHAAHLARIEQLESLLRELRNALNTCRLVIQDDEARDYAGTLVEKARAALANPERRAGG